MSSHSRVLLTGGAGFVGSQVVNALLKDGSEVAVLDNLSTGRLDNLTPYLKDENFRFINGDVCDPSLVQDAVEGVDAILHMAAIVSIPRSLENPLLVSQVNIAGTLNLLKACMDVGVKRFVYTSSCAVYGDAETSPQHEELPCSPTSPYSVTKIAAENYCRVFHKVFGLETVSLRLFNVYGPRKDQGPYADVVTVFVNRLLNGDPPTIYGDGEQSRDFVYVTDVAEAILLALRSKNAVGEVFNIGSGNATSINELAQLLIEIVGKGGVEPIHLTPRKGDICHSCADIRKAESALGYQPKVSLLDGLGETVNRCRRIVS